jgi:hypothetical protein
MTGADESKDTVYPPKSGWPSGDPTDRTTQLVDRAIGAFREVVETRLTGIDRATELVARDLVSATSETDLAARRMQAHTTEDIRKLRELIEANLETIGARINGMDTATRLLADSVAKFPSDVDRAVQSATDLILSQLKTVEAVSQEKFSGIEGTFEANALALTAALSTQKEAAAEQNKSNTLAISKSEQAQKETTLANAAQTNTGLEGLLTTLTDLKDRVVRLEAKAVNLRESDGDARAASTYGQTDRIAGVIGTRMTINTAIAAVSAMVAVVAVIFAAVTHK